MSSGQITVRKNTLLTGIIKLQLVLMIVYEGWYLEKYTAIPGLLQILAVAIIGTTFLLLITNTGSGKNKLIKYWIFFGVYCAFAAIIINADLLIVFDSLFTFFAFIAVVYCAGVVSKYTSDYSWFSKAILLLSIISAFCALFYGVPYDNGGYTVTTISEYNNPNTLGLLMGIGTFMAVFPEHKPRLVGWLVRIALMFIFLWVTVNTGSRSALLCEVAVIILFVYSQIKNAKKVSDARLIRNIALVAVGLIVTVVMFNIIRVGNVAGSAIRRLFENFNSESFTGRTDLYAAAWSIYIQNPVFGIGYKCFETTSGFGYFMHSTYMELLSCTGTIGFVLFLWPVIKGTWGGIRAFRRDGGRSATILLMMLVSGLFGIVYYHMVFLMVLYLEISRIPTADAALKQI